MSPRARTSILLHLGFAVAIGLNIAFWLHAKDVLPQWNNVMAAPSENTASLPALGDKEVAYRLVGYFLQNVGNTGGQFQPLKSYDYATLGKWFFLSQSLDDRANYVPFLAAYYFGALDDEPEKISHVTDYLAEHGALPYKQKWRWLAQAVYFARFKELNMPKALDLSYKLAALDTDTAAWARQMPAFVQLKMGNKQAAYEIMVRMLASEQDKLPANEINAMRDYICTRTLEKAEAAKNPLCEGQR